MVMRKGLARVLVAATIVMGLALVGCSKIDQNLDKTVEFDGFTIQVSSDWELKEGAGGVTFYYPEGEGGGNPFLTISTVDFGFEPDDAFKQDAVKLEDALDYGVTYEQQQDGVMARRPCVSAHTYIHKSGDNPMEGKAVAFWPTPTGRAIVAFYMPQKQYKKHESLIERTLDSITVK